jgi:signal transduction histidine kinase
VVVAATAGELPHGLRGKRVPLSEAMSRVALRAGRAQRISRELNRARFSQRGLGRLGVEAQSGLTVPLIFQGRTHGVLLAIDRLDSGPEFTAEDERLLAAFAVSAAAAVATAHSVTADRSRELLRAAEEERGRWARELHDETLQGLGVLEFSLSAARQTGRPEALEQAVDAAIDLLSTETTNLRSLITDLRPAALDELGLAPATQGKGDRASGTTRRLADAMAARRRGHAGAVEGAWAVRP